LCLDLRKSLERKEEKTSPAKESTEDDGLVNRAEVKRSIRKATKKWNK